MIEMNGLGTKKMERYTWEQSQTLDPVRVLHKLPWSAELRFVSYTDDVFPYT